MQMGGRRAGGPQFKMYTTPGGGFSFSFGSMGGGNPFGGPMG